MKLKNTIAASVLMLFLLNGCILEDFDTIPVNIPVSLPLILTDPGFTNSIEFSSDFCIDSAEVYLDYKGKIKKLTLVEVAFRFNEVSPSASAGDMTFRLRKENITGDDLIDQTVLAFTPAQYLRPGKPFILDLSASQLELVNGFLSQNGACFYGYVAIDNFVPANSTKQLTGYVDMLFKAEVEF